MVISLKIIIFSWYDFVYFSPLIEGKEGCLNSQDDILTWADSKEEHDCRAHEVLSKIRGFRFKAQ